MKFLRKKIIYGCESRGDGDSPYLTRWRLLESMLGGAYLHIFHRSDGEDLHDHPWWFVTVILWRGYVDVTPTGCRRLWPGMIAFRPALHVHRVELLEGKPAITLVVHGPYKRDWGFHLPEGWLKWTDYFKRFGC